MREAPKPRSAPGGRTSSRDTIAQLLAAVSLGAFNGLAFVLFLAPPILFWLAWSYPYLVLPLAIAYYLLRTDSTDVRRQLTRLSVPKYPPTSAARWSIVLRDIDTSIHFDKAELKEGRPWPSFAENFWIFRLAHGYHDMQLHLDPALAPSKMKGDEQFVFGLHPHGALADYRILLDGLIARHFPKLRSWRVLAASVLFKFPVWREVALWTHCIDAGKPTAHHAMAHGHSLFVVPGGEHEQILGEYGKEILYLKKRLGFIKLALRYGVPLVPVYVFGASDTFRTSTFLQKRRLALVKRLRIAFPLFWGRFGLPIPREVPLRIVFGAPITFPTKGAVTPSYGQDADRSGDFLIRRARRDVSDELLVEAHETYMAALQKLFDDNKARFGYAERELSIL